MSSCNIDHSLEDVKNKLADQQSYLPADLFDKSKDWLSSETDQLDLNEMFHLLKKYDLKSEEEKQERNKKIEALVVK